MSLYESFSKRIFRGKNVDKDVYVYDVLPERLRVQLVYIMADAIKITALSSDHYKRVVEILCREYGQFDLVQSPRKLSGTRYYEREVNEFIVNEKDVYKVLDLVELIFRLSIFDIEHSGDFGRNRYDDLVEELNGRFKEHAVGYQFEGNCIVRVDTQLVHAEVIRPALTLVHKGGYEVAESEFMEAFGHYRHGRNSSAMNECLKAFESTMKIICEKNRWQYKRTATASELIDLCIDNGLIPAYWASHFNALKGMLKSSIPTARNKESGHGAGTEAKDIPDYLVSYMINMTASTIVFLISANQ